MANVRVDRLEIRLKGVSSEFVFSEYEDARSLARGLAGELLEQLAEQKDLSASKRTVRIDRVDSGTFQTSREQTSSDLQKVIAGNVVRSIAPKVRKQTK